MKKSAFSLIELSVVILIIGIVIAGVAQSSWLLGEFRVFSARSATKSSPVPSIKNLVVCYESTLEESFIESEAKEDLQVSFWENINPTLVGQPLMIYLKVIALKGLYIKQIV